MIIIFHVFNFHEDLQKAFKSTKSLMCKTAEIINYSHVKKRQNFGELKPCHWTDWYMGLYGLTDATLMSCGEPHMWCKYSRKCNMNTFSLVFTIYSEGLSTIKENLLKTQRCDQKVSLVILYLQHLLTLHPLLLNYILKIFILSVVTVKDRNQKPVSKARPCALLVRDLQHLVLKGSGGCWPFCPHPLLKMSDSPFAIFQAYLLLIGPHWHSRTFLCIISAH